MEAKHLAVMKQFLAYIAEPAHTRDDVRTPHPGHQRFMDAITAAIRDAERP